jgi:hypothetical protein
MVTEVNPGNTAFLIAIAGRALFISPLVGIFHRRFQPHLDQM